MEYPKKRVILSEGTHSFIVSAAVEDRRISFIERTGPFIGTRPDLRLHL